MFTSVKVWSQTDSLLLQTWTEVSSFTCGQDERSATPSSSYELTFSADQQLTMKLIRSGASSTQGFEWSDDKILLKRSEFDLLRLSKDTLILSQQVGDQCVARIYLSQNTNAATSEKVTFRIFLNKGDTIYYPDKGFKPALEGFKNYDTYFQEALSQAYPNQKYCKARFQFIVMSDGSIRDADGSLDCDPEAGDFVKQTISKTAGQWTPMTIYEQAVHSMVTVEFMHKGDQ